MGGRNGRARAVRVGEQTGTGQSSSCGLQCRSAAAHVPGCPTPGLFSATWLPTFTHTRWLLLMPTLPHDHTTALAPCLQAAKIATALAKDVHYTVDEKQRNVLLTEEGYEAAEDVLQVADLYDPREQWASYLLNAIKAKELFIRDVSYIVRSGEVRWG